MLIKKVIVDFDFKYKFYASLRILFYDHNGNLFESGSTISSTNVKAETDNFIVTARYGSDNVSSHYPINAISTEVHKDINNASLSYFKSNYSDDALTIEFKTTQLISKIKVCTKTRSDSAPVATLRVIDIKDNEESYFINDTLHEAS